MPCKILWLTKNLEPITRRLPVTVDSEDENEFDLQLQQLQKSDTPKAKKYGCWRVVMFDKCGKKDCKHSHDKGSIAEARKFYGEKLRKDQLKEAQPSGLLRVQQMGRESSKTLDPDEQRDILDDT